jgi:hypothetical protein
MIAALAFERALREARELREQLQRARRLLRSGTPGGTATGLVELDAAIGKLEQGIRTAEQFRA